MPSSKPAPFSFVNMDELRDQLQFIVDDLYSKIDFALGLDGKGVMSPLQYGGLGRDLSAVNAILGVANGESIDVVPLNTSGGLTDVATLNASTSAHGFLKKLSGSASEFMNGAGNWVAGMGGIKSVQRGVEVAAGTTTITAVNVNKSFILSVSKGSNGYVAARGDIAGTLEAFQPSVGGTHATALTSGFSDKIMEITGTRSLSGGTTDLTVKQFSAVLTNSTTVTFDGPCEWQVIEFN